MEACGQGQRSPRTLGWFRNARNAKLEIVCMRKCLSRECVMFIMCIMATSGLMEGFFKLCVLFFWRSKTPLHPTFKLRIGALSGAPLQATHRTSVLGWKLGNRFRSKTHYCKMGCASCLVALKAKVRRLHACGFNDILLKGMRVRRLPRTCQGP